MGRAAPKAFGVGCGFEPHPTQGGFFSSALAGKLLLKPINCPPSFAKQTRAGDKLRYVPLEPVTIKLLKPLAMKGAVIPVADSTFYRVRQNLCKEMRVR